MGGHIKWSSAINALLLVGSWIYMREAAHNDEGPGEGWEGGRWLKDRGMQPPLWAFQWLNKITQHPGKITYFGIVRNLIELYMNQPYTLWNLTHGFFIPQYKNTKFSIRIKKKSKTKTKHVNLWRDSQHPRVLCHYSLSYLCYRNSPYVAHGPPLQISQADLSVFSHWTWAKRTRWGQKHIHCDVKNKAFQASSKWPHGCIKITTAKWHLPNLLSQACCQMVMWPFPRSHDFSGLLIPLPWNEGLGQMTSKAGAHFDSW